MSDDLSVGGMASNDGVSPQGDAVSASDTGSEKLGTIASGNGSDQPVSTPADWPEDWRTKLAGEDKSYLKTLDRFNSPSDLAKAYRDAQQRLSSGNLRSSLPDNPTEQELKAWRSENGVPESADGYSFDLGDGFVWSDTDKPLLDDFAKYAHENNIPSQYAKKIADFYASQQGRNVNLIQDFDERNHQEAEDNLRREWGNEYRKNLNAINNVLDSFAPDDFKTQLYEARLPNGKILGDDPRFLKVMAAIAREANPTATVVPSNGFANAEDELSTLQKKVGTKEYWADKKMQARYQELLGVKVARESKGRAA